MNYLARVARRGKEIRVGTDWRLTIVLLAFLCFSLGIIVRLFILQVVQHENYIGLSERQYLSYRETDPLRGAVYILENFKGGLVAIAENRKFWEIYAVPYEIEDPSSAAGKIAPLLEMDTDEEIELKARLAKGNDPFEPIQSKVTDDIKAAIETLGIRGIYAREEVYRYYPTKERTAQLIGFLGYKDDVLVGNYGIEGYFENLLAGSKGVDSVGPVSPNSARAADFKDVRNGSAIVLTIDSVVQFKVCQMLTDMVQKSGAESGTVIVMESATGKVRAMCSSPSFDPNVYFEVDDIDVFNNPAVFEPYEPGSVFKPITMAAALNEGVVTPDTTYVDEGEREIAEFTIRNSDGKAHGETNMTTILTQSLNLGAIFVAEQMDKKVFSKYVHAFGFGEKTGIEVSGEQVGQVDSIIKRSDIYAATASYGQGITATPIQLVSAYNAIARRGSYIPPTIIEKITHEDGFVQVMPEKESRQILTPKAATLLSSMLVTVVEDGHATAAAVDGYVIGGKTGTAQIARSDGKGYEENLFNHTFIGYGPVDNPFFTMLVKLEKPTSYEFSSGTAAPLFGQIAKFILQYYNIPPSS